MGGGVGGRGHLFFFFLLFFFFFKKSFLVPDSFCGSISNSRFKRYCPETFSWNCFYFCISNGMNLFSDNSRK